MRKTAEESAGTLGKKKHTQRGLDEPSNKGGMELRTRVTRPYIQQCLLSID